MSSHKLAAGTPFPVITVPLVNGEQISVGAPNDKDRWTLVVVYRGRHCPLCVKYLDSLQSLLSDFDAVNTDVVAVSGDGLEKAKEQVKVGNLTFPLAYDLSIEQMKSLGLYISNPRSPEETDQPFPEPGLFVIRPDGTIQILDISNAPFSRPDLSSILRGITFIQEKGYPVRGTYS
ncbi:peroxiredoxin-like family protein [Sneathiella sp.]|uniref:peroxiredoxin-like family protein n=1 Tax=Sneathiella sp. TaxID=1964365 RepID=UPI0039E52AAF